MKNSYELKVSQVHTPHNIVSFFWKLVAQHRSSIPRVLDLGAGDGRFAMAGTYGHYDGVEIDPQLSRKAKLHSRAKLFTGCAFRYSPNNYDACIGNPPYVRHHDIESPWKEQTSTRIREALGIDLSLHRNLYLYFLCLGFIKTHPKGLTAFLIPFEWVSRPSAASIRDYIKRQKWSVSVYRFEQSIFDGVLTTASISIIDKDKRDGAWTFHDVTADLSVKNRNGITGKRYSILCYAARGDVWARRGVSPGSQRIFTLTDGERIHAGLSEDDVVPCVTTLTPVPRDVRKLSWATFRKYIVQQGERCWLIRSTEKTISARLRAYLNCIPTNLRQTYTCLHQEPWYAYEIAPVPKLLFHSGFMEHGPKVLTNSIGAHAVGAMYGIHADSKVSMVALQKYLLKFNFERRIVQHAKTLKKIEVKQLNAVLNRWRKASKRV